MKEISIAEARKRDHILRGNGHEWFEEICKK